jgi:hypothetical protein
MKGKYFKEPLLESITSGQKTQWREVVKPQPIACFMNRAVKYYDGEDRIERFIKPRYEPGEKVYIKEPFAIMGGGKKNWGGIVVYKHMPNATLDGLRPRWNAPITMPRKYARFFIRITDIICERLQEISSGDCWHEGIITGFCGNEGHKIKAYYVPGNEQPYVTPESAYEELVDSIYGKGTWKSNPYVYAYEFKLIL